MKKLILFFCLLFALSLNAQTDDESYTMFETIMLEPDLENIAALSKNLEHHNKTYHQEGAHRSTVFYISTGPNAGNLIWMMGPLTFTDLDSRPAGEGHDGDWGNNVLPNLEKVSNGEYWRRDDDLSSPASEKIYPIYLIRYHDFKKGIGDRGDNILKQMSKTVMSMEDANYWAVYDNIFRQGYVTGRHLAITIGFDKWAEFDEDVKFKAAYEKLYGEGTFDGYLREWNEVFTNAYDEIWTYDAALSGHTNTDESGK